jgi:hypothetical protein
MYMCVEFIGKRGKPLTPPVRPWCIFLSWNNTLQFEGQDYENRVFSDILVDYLANVGGIKDSFVPGRVAKDQCKFNIRNGWEISFGSVCVRFDKNFRGQKKLKGFNGHWKQ